MDDVGRVELAPGYSIAPVINGCWQLTPDHGGGPACEARAMDQFARLFEQGFTTFDCADIYTGVEALLGRFRRSLPDPDAMQVHTKLVPDKSGLASLTDAQIDTILHRSLQRLGVERLDLVQFHWWDYRVPGMLRVAERLMRAQQAGKLRLIGATNFNTGQLRQLLDHGVPVVSLQAQYSLLDRRPERHMAQLAQSHGVQLLPYGVLAGGFLSARYLDAVETPPANRSLTKYRLIIDEAGGWPAFQALLRVLAEVGSEQAVGPELVAARWVLDQPMVPAIILGVGSRTHAREHRRLLGLQLDTRQRARIDRALQSLAIPAGDMYDLERDERGPHAGIIKTDLQGLKP